jgi:hypothetical protein
MNCIIKFQAMDGRYGRPGKDREGPLKEFIVDNQFFYSAVFKHVLECDACSPEEVLKEYLNRRIHLSKFKGVTSTGLVKLSLKYKKKFPHIDSNLVREIIIRSADFESIQKIAFDFSSDDWYRVAYFCFRSAGEFSLDFLIGYEGAPYARTFNEALRAYDRYTHGEISVQQVKDLITISMILS